MRRSDTAKQRVWLGTNQYRGCCRNATTNPNRLADSCVKRYTVRRGNTHAYSNSYSNGDGDGNCHSYAECNSDTDGNGYSYHYSISDTYGDTKSHAETSADSASPAVNV